MSAFWSTCLASGSAWGRSTVRLRTYIGEPGVAVFTRSAINNRGAGQARNRSPVSPSHRPPEFRGGGAPVAERFRFGGAYHRARDPLVDAGAMPCLKRLLDAPVFAGMECQDRHPPAWR